MTFDDLISQDQMFKIDLAIQSGAHRKRALRAHGVSESTYRKVLRLAADGEPGAHAFIVGLEQAEAKAEGNLVAKLGSAKDWRAAAFILERRYPEEWGQKIQVEVKKELEKVFTVAEEILTEEQFVQLLEGISRVDGEGASSEAEEVPAVH